MKKQEHSCFICKGIGLRKRDSPFICKNCKNCNNTVCYLCENANKGLYIECEKCFGSGVIYINDNNNENIKKIKNDKI